MQSSTRIPTAPQRYPPTEQRPFNCDRAAIATTAVISIVAGAASTASKPLATAVQIEKDCPIEVEALGFRIAAHLQKARDYEAKAREKAGVELRKADDNWTTVIQLLAEAKAKCSAGGFKAFQEKYCPNLSRSRIYELLEIGSGKKTLEESRAANRERVAKHRGKVSVTNDVTDRVPPAPIKAAIDAAPEAKPSLSLPAHPHMCVTLGCVIQSEWRKAIRTFETLTRHTPAQVATAISLADVPLITEIADYFVQLAKCVRPTGNGEAPVADSDCSTPGDLSIPLCLRRGGAS